MIALQNLEYTKNLTLLSLVPDCVILSKYN